MPPSTNLSIFNRECLQVIAKQLMLIKLLPKTEKSFTSRYTIGILQGISPVN